MSNISKNFQNKAKRGLKCGAYADGVVPSYEEQAAAMEAEQIAAAKAKFAPQPKPGLMARVFGAARPAPAPAPEPTPAPSVVDTIKNRNNTLRTIANYANGKVPTHVGPGVVDGPGEPEIGENGPVDRPFEQNVRRLDIAMNQPLGMSRRKAM